MSWSDNHLTMREIRSSSFPKCLLHPRHPKHIATALKAPNIGVHCLEADRNIPLCITNELSREIEQTFMDHVAMDHVAMDHVVMDHVAFSNGQ